MMEVHFNLEQGSLEWHLIRWGKIGGTLAGGLFIDSDNLLMDVLSEQTEQYDEDAGGFMNDAMLRGLELEPQAREELKIYTGIDFLPAGWVQSDIPILGISPDGITPDLTAGCEIKCPGAKKHLATCLAGEIPKDNIAQCLHFFTVNPKLERLFFLSYRPESIKPLFVKEITRDTPVDIGWTVKGKVKEDRGLGVKEYACNLPDLRPVSEWVEIARKRAGEIQLQVTETINKLNF